jgi:aspartate racemase
MKCIGLIGGIGWESTAAYYRFINEDVRQRCGSLYSARIVLNSLQFQTIDSLTRAGRWNEAAGHLVEAARTLEKAGAEGLVLCSNLMHFVAAHLEAAVSVPLLHLGDAIVETVRGRAASVGLLGTRFTLEHGFLLNRRPHPRWGTSRIHTPSSDDCIRLDRIIYGELCHGEIRPDSGRELLRMAQDLRRQGASVVVLASSELALLLKPDNTPPWLYDSTELHAAAVVRWMLGERKAATDRSKPVINCEPGERVKKRSQLSPLRVVGR